jgi:hypothetical protein
MEPLFSFIRFTYLVKTGGELPTFIVKGVPHLGLSGSIEPDTLALREVMRLLEEQTTTLVFTCSLTGEQLFMQDKGPLLSLLEEICNGVQDAGAVLPDDRIVFHSPVAINIHEGVVPVETRLRISSSAGDETSTREVLVHPDGSATFSSLEPFAAALESVFTEMGGARYKLAATMPGERQAFLLVRCEDDVEFGFSEEIAWFALEPLTGRLVSGTVAVWNYKSGQPFPPAEDGYLQTFSDIDIERWMQQVLDHLSTYLREYHPVTTSMSPQLDVRIMSHLSTLASRLAEQLQSLKQGQQGDLVLARKVFAQQLITDPGTAYRCTTVVQQGMRVSKSTDAHLHAYFDASSTAQADISATGPTLDGLVSYATYVVAPHHPAKVRALEAAITLAYAGVTTADLAIARFVTGSLATIHTGFVFPVPMRGYPEPVPPLTQFAAPALKPQTPGDARTWSYCVDYSAPVAAQDRMKFELGINEASTAPYARGNNEAPPCFNSLARFNCAWPAMKKDFDRYVRAIPAHASDTELLHAMNVLFAFEHLLKGVVQSLAQLGGTQEPARTGDNSYTVVEEEAQGSHLVPKGALLLRVAAEAKFAAQISVKGYSPVESAEGWAFRNAQDKFLMYADRVNDPVRTLVVKGLDILQQQRVNVTCCHQRNMDLVPGIHRRFVYEGEAVTAASALCPQFMDNTLWNIAALSGQLRNRLHLADHFSNFFGALFNGVKMESVALCLNVEVLYQAPLDSGMRDGPFIHVPVLMFPWTVVRTTSDLETVIAPQLGQAIERWCEQTAPDAAVGSLILRTSVSAGEDGTRILLQLSEAYLALNEVEWE